VLAKVRLLGIIRRLQLQELRCELIDGEVGELVGTQLEVNLCLMLLDPLDVGVVDCSRRTASSPL